MSEMRQKVSLMCVGINNASFTSKRFKAKSVTNTLGKKIQYIVDSKYKYQPGILCGNIKRANKIDQ